MKSLPKVGVYEHYKSATDDRRYYQIIGFARHTETNETLVIYIPLYVIEDHKELRLQARPLSMFIEKVEYNGKLIPRFRYIGSELQHQSTEWYYVCMSVYDAYFSNVPKEHVAEFERIRKIVISLVPEAEEAMMYGVPSFKVNGHFFVGFGSNKHGVSFYPSSTPITQLADKLTMYRTSKGAIPYSLDNPLPDTLIKEIVLIRRKAELNT